MWGQRDSRVPGDGAKDYGPIRRPGGSPAGRLLLVPYRASRFLNPATRPVARVYGNSIDPMRGPGVPSARVERSGERELLTPRGRLLHRRRLVAIQGRDQAGYDWLTASRARVLRELADDRTQREAAERLGLSYTTIRSAVQVLRGYTGCENVHDLRRWWRQNREPWADWLLEQGGVSKNST